MHRVPGTLCILSVSLYEKEEQLLVDAMIDALDVVLPEPTLDHLLRIALLDATDHHNVISLEGLWKHGVALFHE